MLQGTQNQQRCQKINWNHTVGGLSTILHELDVMLYQREATKVTEEKRDMTKCVFLLNTVLAPAVFIHTFLLGIRPTI